ncbi:hypothetical protein [Burkholderia pseudomallei]|uniref:hypothetical protein n=1 Tax=Burkholderia pseudomallei TaxID=28450 RepID=UPI000A1A2861|nr:hypothetical protein [Burkholderia pseudomallei]ARL25475.1 hypothetical protein BOC47_24180 [Burkholderia pseudomallei]
MSTDYEKFVPPQLRQLVDCLIVQARIKIELDGFLAPVAFVGQFDKDGVVAEVVACGGLGNLSKDEGTRRVRNLAKEHNADFVLWIDEAWMTQFTTHSIDEAQRKVAEVGGEVRDTPGRIDVVMFVLETHLGIFVANPVREDAKDSPGGYTFGAVEFGRPNHAEGQFAGVLPSRDARGQ